MFSRNRCPVLTAKTCRVMERVRLAIEVLTGQRVSFIQIDFNTCRARAMVGDEKMSFSFVPDRADLISFAFFVFGDLGNWHTARFDESGKVMVINDRFPNSRHGHVMWWVGSSATDRREEPLFLKEVEYCAGARGLSPEEYLASPVD